MKKETMTGRERWLAVLNREKPDRIPMDYWATPEASEKLSKHMGCDLNEALKRLHIDTPFCVGGNYVGPKPKDGESIFGVRYVKADYGNGSYSESANSPLAGFSSVEEIEAEYKWPSPDWWDYSHLPDAIKGHENQIIRGGGSEPFLFYKQLRGEMQAFMDLIENPEIVH